MANLNIRISDAEHNKLKQISKQEGVTISDKVRSLILSQNELNSLAGLEERLSDRVHKIEIQQQKIVEGLQAFEEKTFEALKLMLPRLDHLYKAHVSKGGQ